MPSSFTRRRVLAIGAAIGSAPTAGCSSGCGEGDFYGGGMLRDGEESLERTDEVVEEGSIIEFSALPEAEQSLLRTAIKKGVVRACMRDGGEQTDALRSFARRMNGESLS